MTDPTRPEFNETLSESDQSPVSESAQSPEETSGDAAHNSTSDVMNLIASVEDQLEKMKSAQVSRSSEIQTLESRREDLARREQSICDESERLETLELELTTRLEDLVARENHCTERDESLELMRSALESDSDDMIRREKEITDLRAQLEEDKTEIVLERGRLSGERAELEDARVDFGIEADQLKAELESARQAVADTESIRASLEEQADGLRQQHEQMNHAIEESNSRAESFKAEADSLKTSSLELAAELESARQAVADNESIRVSFAEEANRLREEMDSSIAESNSQVESFKAEAESLKSGTLELAAELESAAGVIERLESAHLEITSELQTCRSELDDSAQTAMSAIKERDEIKANLELAMDRLQALAQAVSDQASQFDEGAIAISRCRELEERMVKLSRDLEEAHDQLNHASAPQGDFDSEELLRSQEELARLRAELESCVSLAEHESMITTLNQRLEEAAAGSSGEGDAQLLEKLDEARCEIETLETHARSCEEQITEKDRHLCELQMRNEELEAGTSDQPSDVSSDAQLLRDQAKRLSAFASHLQLRRVRLREMRRLLSERVDAPTANTGSSIESERLIRVEQEDMVRRRHEMNELESRMIRRWACHTTAGTVVKISLFLVVIATACWFGTRWFAPGTVASTALVRAHPITGGTLDDATGSSWNEWHKALLSDDLFVKSVFNRFQSASLGGAYSVAASSALLGDNMVVTEVEPGMLQIRLNGSSPLETQRLLESVVTTLSSESQRQLARRGDGARVDIVTSDGRLVANDPVPVTSGQFQTAGLAFGGSVVVLGLLGSGIYARLRRSRRIFDENIGIDSSNLE